MVVFIEEHRTKGKIMALDFGWRVYSGETGHWYGDVRTEALAEALAEFTGENRAVIEQIVSGN